MLGSAAVDGSSDETADPSPRGTCGRVLEILFMGPLTTPVPLCPRPPDRPLRPVLDTAVTHTCYVYRHKAPLRSAPVKPPQLGLQCSKADAGILKWTRTLELVALEARRHRQLTMKKHQQQTLTASASLLRLTDDNGEGSRNYSTMGTADDGVSPWLQRKGSHQHHPQDSIAVDHRQEKDRHQIKGEEEKQKSRHRAVKDVVSTSSCTSSRRAVPSSTSPRRRFVVGAHIGGGGKDGSCYQRRAPRVVVERLTQIRLEAQYVAAMTYFRRWHFFASCWRRQEVTEKALGWGDVNLSPLDEEQCDDAAAVGSSSSGNHLLPLAGEALDSATTIISSSTASYHESDHHRLFTSTMTRGDHLTSPLMLSIVDAEYSSGRHVVPTIGSPTSSTLSFSFKVLLPQSSLGVGTATTPDDGSIAAKSPSPRAVERMMFEVVTGDEDGEEEEKLLASYWGAEYADNGAADLRRVRIKYFHADL